MRRAGGLAREHGVQVCWVLGGAARGALPDPFDLVYSCGAIHYVPRRERVHLFPRLKKLTAPGGRHAHLVFTDREIYVEKGEVIDYFAPGELAQAYADWLIVRREEARIECAQDHTAHRHSVEELIARAPGGPGT